jgi:hypothetical protein
MFILAAPPHPHGIGARSRQYPGKHLLSCVSCDVMSCSPDSTALTCQTPPSVSPRIKHPQTPHPAVFLVPTNLRMSTIDRTSPTDSSFLISRLPLSPMRRARAYAPSPASSYYKHVGKRVSTSPKIKRAKRPSPIQIPGHSRTQHVALSIRRASAPSTAITRVSESATLSIEMRSMTISASQSSPSLLEGGVPYPKTPSSSAGSTPLVTAKPLTSRRVGRTSDGLVAQVTRLQTGGGAEVEVETGDAPMLGNQPSPGWAEF